MTFAHLLVVLLPLVSSAAGLNLPNLTSADVATAGGSNMPVLLGANPSSMGGNNITLSGVAGLPSGSPGGQILPSDSGGGISPGGSPVGGGGSSGGGSGGGGSSSAISGNNSAMIQAPKDKQYDKCTGPGDPGPCKQYIYKWRYEPATNECTNFIWGGCEGNPQNRFSTEAECLFHCIGGPHTLPPFLQSTTREPSTTESSMLLGSPYTQSPAQAADGMGGAEGGDGTTPVPIEQRGPELTFAETGQGKTFVFAKNNTFIQMDGDIIQTFQLRLCREISFQFRTRLPHGLLVYHNVKNPDRIILDPYALYVIVEKGQLKVVHVFGKHSTSVTVGESLNRDEWHSVMVRIDVHGARLIARVDNSQEEVYLKGLNHEYNYGVSTNLPSVVLVGGLSSEEKLHGVKYITESFVGCIRNVVLSSGKAASDLLPIAPLVATKHENVNEGCSDMCDSRHNLCFVGSHCINHYGGISCDCFGTHYEGEHCDIYTRNIQLRAQKVASELLSNKQMVEEKLPKYRVPNYKEFRKAIRSIGDVKHSDINVTTFKSMVEMRQAQLDHKRLKSVKSYGHSLEWKPNDRSHLLYRTQLCKDLQQKQHILRNNLSLLGNINKIQRLNGSVNCFNRTFPATDKNSRKIRDLADRLSQENRQLGCRLSQVKSMVNSHNPWAAPLKPIQQKASEETVARFRPYLPSPRLGKRNSQILLRPIVYFDVTVREDDQFLGRVCLKLYTEISPEVVLEFVRLATHNDVQSHRVLRIFPDLWMEGEISPDPPDALKEHHSVKHSFVDHSKLTGILSYPWDYRRHFPQGLLNYTISFKPLAVEPLQRVVFGRVCSGMRVLQNCRHFGTKNGRTKKTVVVTRCGLL